MPQQLPDFGAIFASLEATHVRYVLVGGLAMVAHGSAHVTQDLDLAYAPNEENRQWLVEALALYHPVLRDSPPPSPFMLAAALCATPNLALCTNAGSVDVLGAVAGVGSFEDLWARSVIMTLYSEAVHVAALDDLIAMKRAADRPHDRNHVLELQALRKLLQTEGQPK